MAAGTHRGRRRGGDRCARGPAGILPVPIRRLHRVLRPVVRVHPAARAFRGAEVRLRELQRALPVPDGDPVVHTAVGSVCGQTDLRRLRPRVGVVRVPDRGVTAAGDVVAGAGHGAGAVPADRGDEQFTVGPGGRDLLGVRDRRRVLRAAATALAGVPVLRAGVRVQAPGGLPVPGAVVAGAAKNGAVAGVAADSRRVPRAGRSRAAGRREPAHAADRVPDRGRHLPPAHAERGQRLPVPGRRR